jgi:SWI/SNF-related matrix-associated actin-dependent regulator of chromatin subfamily A3
MDVIDNTSARITVCKHIYCANCIETVIRQQQKCPLCRTALPSPEKTLVAPSQEIQEQEDNPDLFASMGESSSKLDALLQILKGTSTFVLY